MLTQTTKEARRRLQTTLPGTDARAVALWLDVALPFDYQQNWALDFSPLSLLNKARQIGGSHASAAWCVLAALMGETVTVISVGEREAREVLEACRRHASMLARLGSTWARPAGRTYGEGEVMELLGGGRVIALPASSGGRSFSGNVFLDEFGYHGEADQKIWDAAAGSTTLGTKKIRIASTPNGLGNMFHELATDTDRHRSVSRHRVTIWDAVAAGYPIDPAAILRDKCLNDPRIFGQLYECNFLDGSEQYIPSEFLEFPCVVPDSRCDEGLFYAGLDLGFVNDLSVLIVLRQDYRHRVWLQQMVCCPRTKWEDQQRIIEESFRDYNWTRLCVDRTGVGLVPTQLLQAKYGVQRVEAVDFTNLSKDHLATGLFQAFADKMIRIPKNDELLRDIRSIKRTVTPTGAVRYDAPRTAKGHADRAWSLALAVHACTSSPRGALPDFDPYGGRS
jgi:phage FluMu gp28-like protein